jgi:hypothetical protein
MDVGPVAGGVRMRNRAKAHAMSQAVGNRLRELAGDHGMVGGPNA